MRTLDGGEAPPRCGKFESQTLQLFEVQGREGFEPRGAVLGELQAYDTTVTGTAGAHHESATFSAVDESDRAVVLEQKVVRHLADRGPARIVVSADRE